jgi:branched-chain amino acid transport system permease protein
MGDYWIEVFTLSALNCIVALGQYSNMSAGLFALCYAAFMGIGSYAAAVLCVNFGVPFPFDVFAAAAITSIVGILFSLLSFRLAHWFLAVASIAFGESVSLFFFNTEYFGASMGFQGVPLRTSPWIVFAFLTLIVLFFVRFNNSRLGQSFRVVKEDEETAAAMGINVRLTKVYSFAIGTFIAGIGGAVTAHYYGVVEPKDLGMLKSFEFFIFVSVGGIETFWGPVVGTFALSVLPELLRFSLYDRYIIYGVVLVLLMILRPRGIVTRRPLGSPGKALWGVFTKRMPDDEAG